MDDEGVLYLITFYSKNIIPAEYNYKIYNKEFLVIVYYLEYWYLKLELTNISIQIFTNYKSLEYFI